MTFGRQIPIDDAKMHSQMLDELGAYPCAVIAESEMDIDNVIKETKRLSKPADVLIAVKERPGVEKRLLPAYINAYLRYKEKSMHSDSLSIETLLFVAGSMNIANAIDKVAAEGRRFILFSSSDKLAESLIRKAGLKKIRQIKLVLDANVASDVAMTAIKDDK